MLYDFVYMKFPEKTNVQTEGSLVAACGWGQKWAVTANGHKVLGGGREMTEMS